MDNHRLRRVVTSFLCCRVYCQGTNMDVAKYKCEANVTRKWAWIRSLISPKKNIFDHNVSLFEVG
jgi:hypothetical protein